MCAGAPIDRPCQNRQSRAAISRAAASAASEVSITRLPIGSLTLPCAHHMQMERLLQIGISLTGSAGADRGLALLHQPCRRVFDRYPLEGELVGNRAQHALVEFGRSERRRRRIAAHLILEGIDVFHRFRLRRVERRQDGFANRRRHGYAALDAQDLAGLDIIDEEVDEFGCLFPFSVDAPMLQISAGR